MFCCEYELKMTHDDISAHQLTNIILFNSVQHFFEKGSKYMDWNKEMKKYYSVFTRNQPTNT